MGLPPAGRALPCPPCHSQGACNRSGALATAVPPSSSSPAASLVVDRASFVDISIPPGEAAPRLQGAQPRTRGPSAIYCCGPTSATCVLHDPLPTFTT